MSDPDQQLDLLLESMMAMARLDFSLDVPELGVDDRMDALAASANMLREELHTSTVSRAYLDGIIHAMSEGLLVVDVDGIIADSNQPARALLGRSADELAGQEVQKLFPESDWSSLRGGTAGAPAVAEFELEASGRFVRVSATPLDALQHVLVCADVTAQRELQSALARARDEALAAGEQRTRFLANMSHEIRTPINGVIGMAELILRTELDTRQKEMAATIDLSARALLDVVNDILDFSRIDSGKLELESLEFELASLVEDVLEMHAVTASRKRLELIASVSAGLPARLVGDPSRVRQILSNLVSNAIKFTDEGEIGVHAWREGPEQPVQFEVRDTGIGIPEARVEKLFDPFVQADQSTTRKYGGSGLGLAICKQLTDAMGGTLSCRSVVGDGSRFLLSLPFGESKDTGSQEPDLAGVRVLVVDDNETNRDVLAGQLKAWGAVPTTASSASEAFGILREANVHRATIPIALLDMHMPSRSGLMLAKDVSQTPEIVTPLMVLLTSLDAVPNREAVRVSGINQILHKPVRSKLLRGAINALLTGRSTEPRRSSREIVTFPGRRVLVAEDNPINQRVIETHLERLKIAAVCVGNGQEAVEMMDQPWDLILMDARMPVLDGFDATRTIRGLGIDTPILALSADVVAEARAAATESGMNGFLPKPVTEEMLVSALVQWLGDEVIELSESTDRATAPPTPATLFDPFPIERLAQLAKLSKKPEMVDDLVRQFKERLPAKIAAMRAATVAGDHEQIIELAHALRGSASTLGATRVATVADSLERGPADRDQWSSDIDALERLVEPTFAELERAAEQNR